VPKTELPSEVLEKIEEKKQLAKLHRVQKKTSKPLTKEDVKKRLGLYSPTLEAQMKKTDYKFEPVRISHGSGKVHSPTQIIKPNILGATQPTSEPDWTLCKCHTCPLFGKYCNGRRAT